VRAMHTSEHWPMTRKIKVQGPASSVRSQYLGPSHLRAPSILLVAVVVLFGSLFAASVARGVESQKATAEALGNEVQCPCSCVAPLNQCPMLNCAEKAEMRAFIAKEIAEGKGETAILQDLSIRYGVQVLSSPPAHGFSLAVWILPGLGLLVGLGIVVVIVKRWNRQPPVAMVHRSADPKILTAVEEEMKTTKLG
jgi:cytochrome c-type biogenesis protein CcmH